MQNLAKKAIYSSKPPFPLFQVGTTLKFKDINSSDKTAHEAGMELIVYQNLEALKKKINPP